MPNFFIKRKQKSKQGEKRQKTEKGKVLKKIKKKDKQDEISSEEEFSAPEAPEFSSDEEETEQEKKLRLTKKYLQRMEDEEREKKSLTDARDAVSQRLKDEALEDAGRLQKKKAHEYENVVPDVLCVLRGHNLSITCVVVSTTEKFLFSASKDGSIIKWSIEEKKKLKVIRGGKKDETSHIGHTAQVLALALSADDKFLASGCRNKIINIWNPDTLELLKTFKGHRDAVTALVFQRNAHQLISASSDRSLKLWNLDEMGYVETLFGHEDAVLGIDSFVGENALTCGGRDSSVRIWKIVEETQLLFRGSGESIDCVCMSSFQSFVSGGDDGSLCLWGVNKKKPMAKVPLAHGTNPETELANWIVSLCSMQNTDLIASGSTDGFIRLWRREEDNRSLTLMSKLPLNGFINSLQFSSSGDYLIAGVGQEHRLGRWWRIKDSKNSIVIFSFKNKNGPS